MLDWLFNFGTGVPAWTMFIVVIIGMMIGAWVVMGFTNLVLSIKEDDGLWKSHRNKLVLKALVFVIFIFTFTNAFGPGTPPQELPSDIGVMEYVDKAPDMKTPVEIQKEAEAKVDPFLKKQDEGFKAEQEEADAYLEKIRKKHQNQ